MPASRTIPSPFSKPRGSCRTIADIKFLLSGEGVGWTKLKEMQAASPLPNVTLIERVPEAELESFLSAGDVWIVPYRKNNTGVSVPSRIYNLLAVGRPIIICSEPDAEAAHSGAGGGYRLGRAARKSGSDCPDHPPRGIRQRQDE